MKYLINQVLKLKIKTFIFYLDKMSINKKGSKINSADKTEKSSKTETSDKTEITSKSNIKRKLIKKEACDDDANKNAVYHYEIYSDNGELIGTQKVISRSKTFSNKYKDEDRNIVLDTAIKYFSDNNIPKPKLYKLSYLNTFLKPCCKSILDNVNIKITQKKLKDIIKSDYLEL